MRRRTDDADEASDRRGTGDAAGLEVPSQARGAPDSEPQPSARRRDRAALVRRGGKAGPRDTRGASQDTAWTSRTSESAPGDFRKAFSFHPLAEAEYLAA